MVNNYVSVQMIMVHFYDVKRTHREENGYLMIVFVYCNIWKIRFFKLFLEELRRHLLSVSMQ